jgi:TnpA family transposase
MRRRGFRWPRPSAAAKSHRPTGCASSFLYEPPRVRFENHTLHAGPNSKYFDAQRGVTYYSFTCNQFSGFHGIVVPGTLHDSPYVPDRCWSSRPAFDQLSG